MALASSSSGAGADPEYERDEGIRDELNLINYLLSLSRPNNNLINYFRKEKVKYVNCVDEGRGRELKIEVEVEGGG